MVNLTDREHFNHLEVSWKPLAMAQLTLGGMFFAGDGEGYLFGQYDEKDFIFTRLTLIF